MKISKIFAGMSAMAIAATMTMTAFAQNGPALGDVPEGVTADENQAYFDLLAMGYEPSSVYHCTVYFDVADPESGFGGCFMWNDVTNGWQQDTDSYGYSDPDAGSAIIAEGGDGSYYVDFDVPSGVFTNSAEYEGEEYYAQICMQQWWGELTITGVEISGDPAPEQPAEGGDSSVAAEGGDSSVAAGGGEDSSAASSEASSAAESTANSTANSSRASGGSTGGTTGGGNAGGTTTTSASTTDAVDNTNQATGATAGLALAGLALAGAVAVVSKRK